MTSPNHCVVPVMKVYQHQLLIKLNPFIESSQSTGTNQHVSLSVQECLKDLNDLRVPVSTRGACEELLQSNTLQSQKRLFSDNWACFKFLQTFHLPPRSFISSDSSSFINLATWSVTDSTGFLSLPDLD